MRQTNTSKTKSVSIEKCEWINYHSNSWFKYIEWATPFRASPHPTPFTPLEECRDSGMRHLALIGLSRCLGLACWTKLLVPHPRQCRWNIKRNFQEKCCFFVFVVVVVVVLMKARSYWVRPQPSTNLRSVNLKQNWLPAFWKKKEKRTRSDHQFLLLVYSVWWKPSCSESINDIVKSVD